MPGRSKESGKRPWLAALLGTLATGLGHVYLRRWKRGFGWFVVAIGVSTLLVPPETARAVVSGGGVDATALAPLLAVGLASVADAYVLARMRQRGGPDRDGLSSVSGADANGGTSTAAAGNDSTGPVPGSAECPECGKELDPELDFCPWCTTRLGGEREE